MTELGAATVAIPRPHGGRPQSTPATARVAGERRAGAVESDRGYIRGSSLLLGGRLISIVLNFAVQVVTVRYLAKADYGVFAYALAVVAMGSSAVQLGLDKSLPRLVPIYHERGDYARIFGTIALATMAIWGLGAALVLGLIAGQGIAAGTVVSDPRSLSLLLVMIALSPVQAYTSVLERLVAVFASPRAIFFRRHVLGPGLKLAAVLVVVAASGGVFLLAYGYLIGGVIGVALYIAILIREWRKRGLLQYLGLRRLAWPVRELAGFSLPLLSSDLLMIVRTSFVAVVLEHFRGTAAVAEYQAVLPVAGLNMLAYEAFVILFVPLASRMFARQQHEQIGRLYWTTATWIAVLTFPVFALTCALAEPLTVLLFGAKYAGGGLVLSILAFGYYVHAALGFNSASLRVHGKLRLIVASDILSALALIGLSVVLVPRYGALGAAVATTTTLVLNNVLAQLGLWLGGTGIPVISPPFVGVCGIVLSVTAALLIGQWMFGPPIIVGLSVAVLVSLLVIRLTRRALNPEATFPELLRIPLVRQLISQR